MAWPCRALPCLSSRFFASLLVHVLLPCPAEASSPPVLRGRSVEPTRIPRRVGRPRLRQLIWASASPSGREEEASARLPAIPIGVLRDTVWMAP